MAAPKLQFKKKKQPAPVDNRQDKQKVEGFINNISTKLKDPDMAKKAAQIIEEMLKEKDRQK